MNAINWIVRVGIVGIDLAPLIAGAGIAGVALGFGAQTLVRDVIDALERAADDDRIGALYLDLDALAGSGLTKLQDVASAIDVYKATGKPVIAYAGSYGQGQYYLASRADEISGLIHREAGKPVADIDRPYDPLWWLKKLLRREKVSVLPRDLTLRKRIETEVADQIDAARERLELPSRTALIRRALMVYLAKAGETEVAALLEQGE